MSPMPPAIPPEPPVPIRSYVPTTPAELSPPMSLGEPPVPVLAATIVSSSVAPPSAPLSMPPPAAAELPLTCSRSTWPWRAWC